MIFYDFFFLIFWKWFFFMKIYDFFYEKMFFLNGLFYVFFMIF